MTAWDAIVVGGGIAGLRVASRLRVRGWRVLVLEARRAVGGRIRTRTDDRGNVLYERGAWRVPYGHWRVRRLCEELGVELRAMSTPTPTVPPAPRPMLGLSIYDVHVHETGDPQAADRLDQETGFADETHAASSTTPYVTSDKRFLIATDGLSALTQRLAASLPDVRTSTRVTDVSAPDADGLMRVTVVGLTAGGHATANQTHIARHVFVCVPPDAAREWPSFYPHARAHLHGVVANPLHHIYVRHPHAPGMHVQSALSPLVQTISSQYGNNWFQGSYTAGRLARFWQHLRLSYPGEFLRFLLSELGLVRGASESDVDSCYWARGYHHWRPVPNFSLAALVRRAISPNPIRYPRLYWAGEAFSSHQAWIEGALETADLAVDRAIGYDVRPTRVRRAREGEMVIENRILSARALDEFAKAHPGSATAIRRHANGSDRTCLFEHIGHSDEAWAIVASLHDGDWTD